jgi:flagellar hook-associated protein 3 FlgL
VPGISPIPTTRVSDALIYQRLLAQLRFDQQEVFRLQQAISTGQKFALPSDNAPAALRSIGLQRLIERKTQVQQSLATADSFLAASDNALSLVSSLLADARGAALGVSDTVSTPEAKRAVAQQVERAITQLIDIGNQSFRGRYLFGGSLTTQQPFAVQQGYVLYRGNDGELPAYGDIDLLLSTSIPGSRLFGAVSAAVQGSVDLNPVLKPETPLAHLRGGQGIRPGSIALSNGTDTRIIDISRASTIGDVARLLEANPPSGSKVTAYVTDTGLVVQLDAGDLTIREVAGGTTVNELGILTETGVGTAPVVGRDLNPTLQRTTPLADLLGTRSKARIDSGTSGGTFLVEARRNGEQLNGVTIQIVAGGTSGAENVTYDAVNKTITVAIEPHVSTAAQVVAALNASPAAADFTARLAPGHNGLGRVQPGTFVTTGGSGEDLDLSSGLQIRNGEQTHIISLQSAQTVEQLLNILNGSPAGVVAQINSSGTGIDIRTRLSGADFAIGENGGRTATQLGLRSLTADTPLSALNFGRGVQTVPGTDFVIRRTDGVEIPIDLDAGLSATVLLDGPDPHDALRLRALPPGTAGNQFQVEIRDSGPGGGNTVALQGNTLVFAADLAAGFTAQDAVDLLSQHPTLSTQFAIELDSDADPGNLGTGLLAATGPVAFSGGKGPPRTIGDVLQQINQAPENVAAGGKLVARLAQFGNGIELVHDRLDGTVPLAVLRVGGSLAAADLGLLAGQAQQSGPPQPGAPAAVRVNLPGANNALVFETVLLGEGGNAFQVQLLDGGVGAGPAVALVGNTLQLSADLSAPFTAQDAIDLLAADPLLSQNFVAYLDTAAEPGNDGSGTLVPFGPLEFAGGAAPRILGSDTNLQEARGAFTALVRLRDALLADDIEGISRAMQMLDEAALEVNFARAELGVRQQSAELLSRRLQDEEIQLRSVLSVESEVDLVEAIIQLNARQASLEASFRTLARTAQLSLLDFL